jgi:hypothetical protein
MNSHSGCLVFKLCFLSIISILTVPQHGFSALSSDSSILPLKKRLNVVVSNKAKKFDPALYSFHFQAYWKRLFHRNSFHFLIVNSLDEAEERISKIMDKENALIGNLWFDSHGHFGRRVSLFEVGNEEVNYQTIKMPYIKEALIRIGNYCDSSTNIGLGSCYSAATFTIPSLEKFPEQRMNGDSLMIGVSELMNSATVFGSEGWVMTNPGIFNNGYALAGKPKNKRYQDPLLLPIWKKLGQWKSYSAKEGNFNRVQTISLDKYGNISQNYMSWLAYDKNQKKQMKIISRLKPGNFDTKYFYKYEYPKNSSPDLIVKNQLHH